MGLRTRVKIDGRLLTILVDVRSILAPTGSIRKAEVTRDDLLGAVKKDYVILRRPESRALRFLKRSSRRMSFIGVVPEKHEGAWPPRLAEGKPVQQSVTRFVFKNAGRFIAWTEYVPADAQEVARPLIAKARAGVVLN